MVAVEEFHRIARPEGELPAQQLIEGDPQRIEVRPVVDRSVHTAGLLGGDIAQVRSPEAARGNGLGSLVRELRRTLETGELDDAGRSIDEDVVGPYILVNDLVAVNGAEGVCQTNGDRQEFCGLQPSSRMTSSRDTAPKSSSMTARPF